MLQRTFVASFGLDTNNGLPATPCRTFAAALALTNPGGEIIMLDSAGYGPVAINKSVSLIAAPGIYGGISVSAGNGLDITAGVVILRGLTINGLGGGIGINVGNAKVHIERCVISNMGLHGICATTANGEVYVRDTQLRSNLQDGLRFEGSVRFVLDRVGTERNGSIGLNVLNGARGNAIDLVSARNGNYGIGFQNGAAGTNNYLALDRALICANGASGISSGMVAAVAGRTDLVVARSTITGNGADGIAASTQGAGAATAQVSDSVIDANALSGVAATGAGAAVVACGNRITRNGSFGLNQTGASTMKTRQDNTLEGNNGGGAQTNGVLTAFAGI
jgi:hypothetical protein